MTVRIVTERGLEKVVFEEWRGYVEGARAFRGEETRRLRGFGRLVRTVERLQKRRLVKSLKIWRERVTEEASVEDEKVEWMRVRYGMKRWAQNTTAAREGRKMVRVASRRAEDWMRFKGERSGFEALRDWSVKRKRLRSWAESLRGTWRKALLTRTWGGLARWLAVGRATRTVETRTRTRVGARVMQVWRTWTRRRQGAKILAEAGERGVVARALDAWRLGVRRLKKEEEWESKVMSFQLLSARRMTERAIDCWQKEVVTGRRRKRRLKALTGRREREVLEDVWWRLEGLVWERRRARRAMKEWRERVAFEKARMERGFRKADTWRRAKMTERVMTAWSSKLMTMAAERKEWLLRLTTRQREREMLRK